MAKYCYSTDLDRCVFSSDTFDTLEMAIAAGREEAACKKCDGFCVGEAIYFTMNTFFTGESMLDDMRDHISDLVGDDLADTWHAGIPKEKIEELDVLVKKWFCDNKFEPTCFYVVNEREYKL